MNKKKLDLFKQSQRLPTWMGGFLTQLQMTLIYVGIANIVMIAITMWYTSGHLIVKEYLPFFTIRHFLCLGVLCWGILIFIDYKFVAPAKQRYLNRQVAKHKNPTLELLKRVDRDNKKMSKDIAEIKEALSIKEGINGSR